MDIFAVHEAEFDEQVLAASHRGPILVDFWADWCAPCHALNPALEQVLAERAGSLRLAKVHADDNMRLAGRYAVRGFPTVILFQDGEERGRFSGAQPASAIDSFLNQYLQE